MRFHVLLDKPQCPSLEWDRSSLARLFDHEPGPSGIPVKQSSAGRTLFGTERMPWASPMPVPDNLEPKLSRKQEVGTRTCLSLTIATGLNRYNHLVYSAE